MPSEYSSARAQLTRRSPNSLFERSQCTRLLHLASCTTDRMLHTTTDRMLRIISTTARTLLINMAPPITITAVHMRRTSTIKI